MFSTILVTALCVASTYSIAVSQCPLDIDITDTTAHIAHITVKNTGTEPVIVYKPNTVLSDLATQDLIVEDQDGNSLDFQGIFINPKRTNISASSFHTFQPSESLTIAINAAKAYKLSGIPQAHITAVQNFKYTTSTQTPSSLNELTSCNTLTSNTASIIPDQSLVAASHHSSTRLLGPSNLGEEDVTYSSCSPAQVSALRTSVSDAILLATNAKRAAEKQAAYWTAWFKRAAVQETTTCVYDEVARVRARAPEISCRDVFGHCADGEIVLYTYPKENLVVPCGLFWGYEEWAADCRGSDDDRAGAVLHEFTHLFGTKDWAYGRSACLMLPADRAANNADSYELYAESVRLGGCMRK